MIVECPGCTTIFPVDPKKVPTGGVHARCSVCSEVFFVSVPQPDSLFAEPEERVEEFHEVVEAVVEEAEATIEEVEEIPEEVEEIPEEVEKELEPEAPPAPLFGKRDPMEKAQRLARVLVSDIILYNPDRHHDATESGRVKEEFQEEIQKSWNEYVEQVGEELANSTDFFNDALNEILAKGDSIF
ncbi:MAG: zinc-ribbon domain-containing protein [Gemmatimonadota bacterium]